MVGKSIFNLFLFSHFAWLIFLSLFVNTRDVSPPLLLLCLGLDRQQPSLSGANRLKAYIYIIRAWGCLSVCRRGCCVLQARWAAGASSAPHVHTSIHLHIQWIRKENEKTKKKPQIIRWKQVMPIHFEEGEIRKEKSPKCKWRFQNLHHFSLSIFQQ